MIKSLNENFSQINTKQRFVIFNYNIFFKKERLIISSLFIYLNDFILPALPPVFFCKKEFDYGNT